MWTMCIKHSNNLQQHKKKCKKYSNVLHSCNTCEKQFNPLRDMGHMSHHDFCYLYRCYLFGFNCFAFKTILYKEKKQYKMIFLEFHPFSQ